MIEQLADAIGREIFRIEAGSTPRGREILSARAAVEALRDPPDEILMAPGVPYQGNVSHTHGLQVRREAWNTMLDAILAEKSK